MAPVVARVVPLHALEAHLQVADEAGAWRPLLRLAGPDAEARAQELRRLLEADELAPLDAPAVEPVQALVAVYGGTWTVRLPNALRARFEAMAAERGGTPEAALARYLEAREALLARFHAARSPRSA